MSLPYILLNLKVWISRCLHSRGFGVQSPWAYRFIRYVVNEHYPYYSYERLAREIDGMDRLTGKLCRLYFRMSNYCQQDKMVDYEPETNVYELYIKAGCHKTDVVRIVSDEEYRLNECFPEGKNIMFARISLVGNYRKFVEFALERASDKSIFIIQGIKKNRESRRFWDEIVADSRVNVTFDLYYCGIITFDKHLYKQAYIVNF